MSEDKLYLVTGAAGHLGSTVIRRLAEKGCSVRALCRAGEKHPPEGAELFSGDVCDKDSLRPFFSDFQGRDAIVIHCAGVVSIASKFNQRVYDVNVTGTRNVVDMSVENGVAKLIYVSSVHAIPEMPKGQTMTEVCRFSPDRVVGLYAKTKAEATAYVFASVERGLDAEVVFPSGIIGPFDRGRSHTNQMVHDYVSGGLTAGVRGGYDFVDVRDVADGILACAEKGRRGEGYILSGGFYSVKELFGALHELTGQREIKTYLPFWFVNAVAPLCELYYKLRKQPPLFTRYSMFTLAGNSSFSNDKAAAQLGFQPRAMRETLSDTVAWMRKTGKLPPSGKK